MIRDNKLDRFLSLYKTALYNANTVGIAEVDKFVNSIGAQIKKTGSCKVIALDSKAFKQTAKWLDVQNTHNAVDVWLRTA